MEDLVTERLLLHQMSVEYAERLVAASLGADAHWAPGYPDEGDVTGARRFLESCAKYGDTRPFGAYEIRRREDGLAIGGMSFHDPPDENGSVTIGYGLIEAAQGNGYASEGLRALIEFARGQGVRSVVGDTDLDNIASQHVMSAAGMRFTGQDERVKYYRIEWGA